MQRLIHFLLGVLCLVVVGFIALSFYETPLETDSGIESVSSSGITSSDASEKSSAKAMISYGPYEEKKVGNGQRAVLFFAAESDPFSKIHDTYIREVVASGSLRIPTYRIEYGSSTGTRLKFGVIVPDTFVLLDGSGNRVSSVIHPTEKELRSLLILTHTQAP